jgi:hypothetical protein
VDEVKVSDPLHCSTLFVLSCLVNICSFCRAQ